MANRLVLHSKLKELLESDEVYYQAPESKKMEYPAIKYSKSSIKSTYANNTVYSMMDRYEIIVMSRTPDHPVIKKLLSLPYCTYDRHYVSENLNHDVLTLYF
jgi:hypothetical protein